MSILSKKRLIWGFVILILIVFTIYKLYQSLPEPVQIKSAPIILNEVIQKEKKENIKLAFVGDMMLDRGVKHYVYKNFAGDYSQLFVNVKDQLNKYDFLFANLEGPISDRGSDQGGIYSFRMEPKVVPILKDVGFNVLSVANNHSFNWGQQAFEQTLELLNENRISYIGGGFSNEETYSSKITEKNGVKFAWLAFSEFPAEGMAFISESAVRDSVLQASLNSDLVIVSFHFGEEYQKLPNAYQKKYAMLAIDSGADLIIGHHPHVVQTLERYKDAYIMYSLGNFIFDQYFSKETMQGGLLEVEVNPESKKIEKVNLKTVQLNSFYQIESII